MLLQFVAIRFLQKLRNFYTSVKMENLNAYLKDFGDEQAVEVFLYNSNKTGLFHTVLDYSTNSLGFSKKNEVQDRLQEFGQAINKAFKSVQRVYQTDDHKKRVFDKVLEKINEEKSDYH